MKGQSKQLPAQLKQAEEDAAEHKTRKGKKLRGKTSKHPAANKQKPEVGKES